MDFLERKRSTEAVSPMGFVRLLDQGRVAESRFVPPDLGCKRHPFGQVVVTTRESRDERARFR